MRRVTINDPTTNRTAPQQPRQRCPEGLEAYKALPAPLPPKKIEEIDTIGELVSISDIFCSPEAQQLGKSPLDFLDEHLPQFSSVTKIFNTRDLLPRKEVGEDFHAACDDVPDVLVIIKSGQDSAGGYTEVPFESRESDEDNPYATCKPNANLSTFVFSANQRKMYSLKEEHKVKALNCDKDFGPTFGYIGLDVVDDYCSKSNWDYLHICGSSFHSQNAVEGELFGTDYIAIDEYEVFRLI